MVLWILWGILLKCTVSTCCFWVQHLLRTLNILERFNLCWLVMFSNSVWSWLEAGSVLSKDSMKFRSHWQSVRSTTVLKFFLLSADMVGSAWVCFRKWETVYIYIYICTLRLLIHRFGQHSLGILNIQFSNINITIFQTSWWE